MYNVGGFNSNYVNQLLKKSGLEEHLGGAAGLSNLQGSIFDIAALSQTDNYEQKGVIVNDLIQKALGFLSSIVGGNGETKKADEEVNKQTQKIEKLKDKSEKLGVELDGSFREIANDIENNQAIIDDATKLLEKTQEDIEAKQEEIQEIVGKIKKAQDALATETDPAKQKELLEEIQGYTTEIATVGQALGELNEQLQGLNEAVTNSANNVQDATAKMEVVEQDGQVKVQELTDEAVVDTQEVAQTAQKGTENKVDAAALGTEANAAKSNPVTAPSLAPKLEAAKLDKEGAAAKRLGSIQDNLNRIGQGIGRLSNVDKIVKDFSTSIGSAIGNYISALGGWETAVNPVLQGLGTLAGELTEEGGLGQLVKAVENDLTKVDAKEEKPKVDDKKPAATDPTKPADSTDTVQEVKPVADGEKEESVNDLETPTVDLSKLLKKEAK